MSKEIFEQAYERFIEMNGRAPTDDEMWEFYQEYTADLANHMYEEYKASLEDGKRE